VIWMARGSGFSGRNPFARSNEFPLVGTTVSVVRSKATHLTIG